MVKPNYKLILSRYITTLCLLLITQIIFYILNRVLFSVNSLNAFLLICRGNLKFSLSALSFYLAPFLLLSLLPLPCQNNKIYKSAISVLYFIATEFIMVINLIDCGYFGFTFKRITFDIFNYLGVGGDFNSLIPTFARDYWHIILMFIVLNFLLYYSDAKFRKKYRTDNSMATLPAIIKYSLVFIISVFVLIVFQRGGLQVRPMNLIHAGNYASTQNTALVLNTPYTFYRTIGKPALEKKQYFSQQQLETIFSPINYPNKNIWTDSLFSSEPITGKTNIMFIIIESMSAEYMGTYNTKTTTYTPFLDSLAKHSLVFDGMSNGKKSIDGIPAIVSSMPLLNETPYITSAYGSNKLSSVADIFKKEGYQTAFFHGGYNGTMNFDGFAKQVGFESYYGKNEYNNNEDYDGNWGIFDEPFLQYTAKTMTDNLKQPFAVTLFTLSNHPPYTIPENHKGKFPVGKVPYNQTAAYTDYSLKRFFETAKKESWFNNTIFVITADHSALNTTEEFKTELGLYKIPVIIYSPMLKHGQKTDITMQQIDILPTMCDMLHLNKKVFAFGKSIFSDKPDYYIYYSNGEYILKIGNWVSKYRDGFDTQLYDLKNDPAMKKNIADTDKQRTLYHEKFTKAVIQQYNNRIISDKTTVTD